MGFGPRGAFKAPSGPKPVPVMTLKFTEGWNLGELPEFVSEFTEYWDIVEISWTSWFTEYWW